MKSRSELRDSKTIWSPGQYRKFGDHRLRPALELLERVALDAPEWVFDLGCGGGEVTRLMAERWPGARVVGVDHSSEMLAEARAEPGRAEWVESEIGVWAPHVNPDLIYSNATLHWLEDHARLFPRLLGYPKPGGCLAVQMPLSWSQPSHQLMRETLANGGPGGSAIGPESLRTAVGRKWVEDPPFYYDLLAAASRSLDIWTTEYLQVLEGEDAVFEWVKGTALRPVLSGLAKKDLAVFLDEYKRRLREVYPRQSNGKTLYPFRRLFIVAMV